MKREIKFRGKQVDTGEWIYGNIFYPSRLLAGIHISPDTNYLNFYPHLEKEEAPSPNDNSGIAIGSFFEVDPKTVGQFTGMTDKNGKEIYEGDIYIGDGKEIKYYQVFYKKGAFCGGITYESSIPLSFNTDLDGEIVDGDTSWLTVIGNIHDNPELINQ